MASFGQGLRKCFKNRNGLCAWKWDKQRDKRQHCLEPLKASLLTPATGGLTGPCWNNLES